jgi:TRAP transporter TAXI family solute receptor
MNKKVIFVGVLLILLFSLIGCGQQAKEPTNVGKQDEVQEEASNGASEMPDELTLASGPSGGNWYSAGAAMADVLTRAGVPTSAIVGGGQATIVGIGEDKLNFGMAMLVDLYSGIEGLEPFDKAYSKPVMLMRQEATPANIIVPADSPVKTLADFKGKTVTIPAPGTSSIGVIGGILEAAGYDIEKDLKTRSGPFTESAELFKDRLVDGFLQTASCPNATISDLAASMPVRFLPVPDDVAKKMIEKNPGFGVVIIPAGTYKGQDEDIKTISSDNALVASKDMPDEHAYWIAKTLTENWDAVTNACSWLKAADPERFGDSGGLPIHPGAEKYFNER